MAKPIVTKSLMKRLMNAAENGSVVATDILVELEKDSSECFGDKKCTHFNSSRYVGTETSDDYRGDMEYEYHTISVNITYCNKDVTNEHFPDRDNPQAPLLPHNRTRISCGSFVGLFSNLDGKYSSAEIQYFDSAMRFNEKVVLRIGTTTEDFIHAYDYNNYSIMAQHGESTLHKSCMRHSVKAEYAADFYANFAKAKIVIAETECGEVLGRALIWDDVEFDEYCNWKLGLVERTYACFDFIHQMIKNFAVENGYVVGKRYNDYCHQEDFVFLADSHGCEKGDTFSSYAYRNIEIPLWNKDGAPYLDTLSELYYDYDKKCFFIGNNPNCDEYPYIGSLRSSCGRINSSSHICPVCGYSVENSPSLRIGGRCMCTDCYSETIDPRSPIAHIKGETRMIDGVTYPISMTEIVDGVVVKSKNFLAFEAVDRLLGNARQF